jgi:hypothetical protein
MVDNNPEPAADRVRARSLGRQGRTMTRTLALLLLVLAACPTGCGGNRARAAWFDTLKIIDGEANGRHDLAMQGYLEAAQSAPTAEDRCLAMALAARQADWFDGERAEILWFGLLQDEKCAGEHDKALYFLADRRFKQGQLIAGATLLERLIRMGHSGYWAREGVERLLEMEETLAGIGLSVELYFRRLYEELKGTDIAGHLLYASARIRHGHGDCGGALYLAMVLVDYHPTSPAWDEGLWEAADWLHEMGLYGDESELLEVALVPNASRGGDALTDKFLQKVRYRLSRLYEEQGRYKEAIYQLALVVNIHSDLQLKDDALWRIAGIYGRMGERSRQKKALAFLVANCPWSRHVSDATKKLAETP